MNLLPLLVPALAVGLTCSRAAWRDPALSRSQQFGLAALLTLGFTLALSSAAALWLEQVGDPWNAARLTPAIALHYGFPLYYPLEHGPVLSTVVGPVAFLAYWPIGFLPASPNLLILAASALNLLAFALIVHRLLSAVSPDPLVRALATLVALQLAQLFPPLRYSLFCIHADAPALALGAAGLLLLQSPAPQLGWRSALLTALCFSLATWAKQSLAPIFPAAILLLALRHDRTSVLRFVGASAAVGLLVSSLFVVWLGFENLRLNMFAVPAHHPWLQMSLSTGEIFPRVSAVGAAAHVKVLVAAMLQIVRAHWPLFALFAFVLTTRWLRPPADATRWPRSPWAGFALTAVALLPTAATGRVKLGGEVNHESFSVFFLALAFVGWLADSTASGSPSTQRWRALAVACVLAAITAPRLTEFSGWPTLRANQNDTALRYDLAHPGRVYFPWNPLTSLLSRGKLEHFDYGVFDRNLGGATVTPAHLAEGLPAPRPIIASYIAHHDHILRKYFPDYVPLPPDPALPDWKLYGAPTASPVR